MAKKKPKSTDIADAVTREEPIVVKCDTITVVFGDDVPGACLLAGNNLVIMPGDNPFTPATVDALKSHPIGERCRVDGKRLREPAPAKD